MERVLLIKYGEIHLKGLNRPFFERLLKNNLKKAIEDICDAKVVKTRGRYFVENLPDDDIVMDKIIDRIKKVFGVIGFSPAIRIKPDIELIKETLYKAIQAEIEGEQTFKVFTKRADKDFPVKSMDFSRMMGEFLLNSFPTLSVDLHNPDLAVNVEIRDGEAYVFTREIEGPGGMPVGSNGKAALLLSGGIDSPVAGWMIAKRGVALDAVHFHSFPYTSERAKQKVIDLAKIMRRSCGPIRLYIVSFTEIQMQLHQKCPDSQLTVLMRRYMMRIAEAIAIKGGSQALITGESIGQVASQTLEALSVTNNAVSMPVFRPLIGMDKVEIMDISRKIDTYETSILPYEDCCTVFVPKHPVTKPKLESIEKSEELIDGEALIKAALDNMEIIKI